MSQLARKTANISAHQGKVGEVVVTKMKNGLVETQNVVSYDSSNGEPDWIVTQPNGERQIITDNKFKSLYLNNANPMKEFFPTPITRPIVPVKENICIKTAWGEQQFIKKSGFLIALGKQDIYGIQETEYNAMYEKVSGSGKNLLLENLAKEIMNYKPKIFVSISYPHENQEQQIFLKQVLGYISSKGLSVVNVKKINDSNVNLMKEIKDCMSTCEGILSLAFCRQGNHTSPFIHIENSLAFACNLPALTITPSNIEEEGVIYKDNNDTPVITFCDCDFGAKSNQDLIKELDKFVNKILLINKNKISDQTLANFKTVFTLEDKDIAERKIISFLKNRYSIKEEEFSINNIYIKRPVEIKAVAIKENGYYQTKNGKEYLQKGDYVVTDIDDKVYSITKQSFEETYLKVSGTEDKYVKKTIPVIVKNENDKLTIQPMHNMRDKYSPDIRSFTENYVPLREYVKSLNTQSNNYENDLNQF